MLIHVGEHERDVTCEQVVHLVTEGGLAQQLGASHQIADCHMEVRVAGRPVRNAREWVRHQNILKVNIVEVEADVVDINYGVRILTRFFPNSGQGRRQVYTAPSIGGLRRRARLRFWAGEEDREQQTAGLRWDYGNARDGGNLYLNARRGRQRGYPRFAPQRPVEILGQGERSRCSRKRREKRLLLGIILSGMAKQKGGWSLCSDQNVQELFEIFKVFWIFYGT